MTSRPLRVLLGAVAASSASALTATGLAYGVPGTARAAGPTSGDRCVRSADAPPAPSRQHVFAAAAASYGVPEAVVLGVSYLESRWDNHGDHPSTAGGYGPMHLTDVPVSNLVAARAAKGDPAALLPSVVPPGLHTIDRASAVTGLSVHELKTNLVANICGGAALLASYQSRLGRAGGPATSVNAWVGAVRRYSATPSTAAAEQFARRVYTVIRAGTSRITNDGHRVTLTAHPDTKVPVVAASPGQTDCPADLACSWVPAPYVWYDHSRPGYYGNHDLAHRPNDLKIDYIVIHDSQTTFANDLQLVQNPTYVSWNYTVRSSDGHVAQHLHPNDVGWHAGNWYVNMHSIGIEHEGYAATGATWYTESMYQSSADLVRHLAAEFGIPLDRAHIIGHDQVPGIKKGYTAGMHWDPGPYWNWQHYMALLGAPLRPDRRGGSAGPHVVTVAPGFTGNPQLVTGCDGHAADACPRQGANFVYLHTRPSLASPLVPDLGLHPDGRPSTRAIADWGARADAGQQLVVARRQGAWIGTWWGGRLGWIHSPPAQPVVLPSRGATVTVKPGASSAPVYGRAFPDRAAYAPYRIRYQPVTPLEYTIKPGQRYVLADQNIQTDYYYTRTYRCQYAVNDCTDVVGTDRYYEIWFNHRIAYVRAADVAITPPR